MYYYFAWIIVLLGAIYIVNGVDDKARYDHYRVYRVYLETDQHVKMFQDIEEQRDSYSFIGHARHTKQNLTIMVAAHKIAEMADLLHTYNVSHNITVIKEVLFLFIFFYMKT